MNEVNHPFWVIVNKEISDHVKSWRFIILIGIIALTCMGSLYTALTNIGATIKPNDPDGSFLFLKLFTASDGAKGNSHRTELSPLLRCLSTFWDLY